MINHKNLRLSLAIGLGGALLIVLSALLLFTAQKGAASAITMPQQPPAAADTRTEPERLSIPVRLPQTASARTALLPTASASGAVADINTILSTSSAAAPPPMPGNSTFVISMDSDRVWGVVLAGNSVTVTVDGVQMGATRADGNGFFWTTLYTPEGNRPNLAGGEEVVIYSDGSVEVSTTLRTVTGQVDALANTVIGNISGTGFPLSLTLYFGEGEPTSNSKSQTATTDSSGVFTVTTTSTWDILGDDQIVIAYTEDSMDVYQRVYAQRMVVLPFPINTVVGWTTPDVAITMTVYQSDQTTIREQHTGTTARRTGHYSFPAAPETGDIIVVEVAGGLVMSRTVDVFAPPTVDAANNRITGQVAPNAAVRGRTRSLSATGYQVYNAAATASGAGAFTLSFSSPGDIVPGQWAGAYVADAEGDELCLWAPAQGSVIVNQTTNEVSGWAVAPPGPLADGHPLTLTLTSAADGQTRVFHKGSSWYGQYTFNQDDGLPDIAAGDTVTVESAGFAWHGIVSVRPMSLSHNLTADTFTGSFQSPSSMVEIAASQWDGWSEQVLFPLGGTFDSLRTSSSGSFTAAAPGFDVRNAVVYDVSHRTSNDLIERVSRTVDYVRIWQQYNGLVAFLWPPGTPYMVSLRDSSGNLKAQVNGISYEPLGNTGFVSFDGTGAHIKIGDQVRVTSLGGFDQTIQVVDLALYLDEANDHVSGYGPANALLSVYVDGQGTGFVPTDATGRFAVNVDQLQDFYGDGDLAWGQWARVCYQNEEANMLCFNRDWPQITAHYAMDGYSEVWGYGATPNSTLYITVTNPGGIVVASGSTPAGSRQGDTTSFSLEFPDDTIRPGNTVTVNFGSGVIEAVTVADLDGTPDVDADIVEGRGPADSQLHLNVDCWRGGCWSTLDNVPVDGSGHFSANFGANGNPPHDIRYGDSFNIHHSAYHNHQTQYSFWLDMAEVGVQKSAPGGFARPGGVYVYTIEYWNDGMSDAENVRIVDTLPEGASWAGDTSGVTPEIGAGTLTWNLGTLPPPGNGDNRRVFAVTLNVADTVTENLPPNCAAISTSTPGDDISDNNTACTGEVEVRESDVGISVDKWANPGDLAPGQKFDYTIRWCSESGASFGPVWLTDTLPLRTTFLGWDANEWPQGLWTEVSATDEQLVLYAAGLPGDRCQHINVHLQLDPDVPLGTILKNVVVASTPDDVNPQNNIAINTSARVSQARYDLNANKWFNQGVLAPGGWARYGANYWNAGNTAVHAYITDTLPSGTSYRVGSGMMHNGQPFEPVKMTATYVVWDLGVVDANSGAGFDFTLNINESAAANAVLNNCVTVGSVEGPEISPEDNTACTSETILAAGPNLRVVKSSEWHGDGQLGYTINFYNLGDQAVLAPWITDTLPADTNWDGWWNLGFDWGRLSDQDLNSDTLAWQFTVLYPGDAGNIQFNANLDNPGTLLRWYTNTVAISDPANDANHADNAYTDVAFSGGEVEWVDFDVYRRRVWGCAPQGPVTVATDQATMTFGNCWNENNFPDTFDPGDTITVTAGAGLQPVIITVPDPFTGRTSSITDTVWGQIDALNRQKVQIDLWNLYSGLAETDANGRYTKTPIGIDIPHGAPGDVNYYTEINDARVGFHHRLVNPDLTLQVNYAHDWVEGDYEPGHTLVLTVTDSAGAIKATAALTTGVIPWWNDRTGFSTNLDQPWFPARPDIVPGDWVYGMLDGIHASSVKVGALDSVVDTDNDLVTVTLQANWLSQIVGATCNVENGPQESFSLAPNGGSYVCDFDLMGWDLLPGQNVWLWYTEPDWDQVGNVVAGPAPHLRINTWGESAPAAGSNFIFRVSYRNEGDAVAEDTVITATLTGATYLADTSGFAHSGGGSGPIVWDVGDLAPGDWVEFYLFVRVTANQGETVGDLVRIATANPDDTSTPEERESAWSAIAGSSNVSLDIEKWSWTDDPTPDTDIVFTLHVCNYGGTASNAVTITDTLGTNLTLQAWWSEHPGWVEISSSAHQLVLTRPSIAGSSCTQIYVRAHVNTSSTGMELSNTAVLGSSDGGDTATWIGFVGGPRTNLAINKSWNRGQLVPGGLLYYNINYANNGNLPVAATFRITDTLPAHTTFNRAYVNTPTGQTPFTPTLVGNGYVVWEVNGLNAGYNVNFEVALNVAWDAASGATLTNTAAIEPQPGEDTYDDNTSVWVETLNAYGVNLRVRKTGQWDNWGRDTRRASYQVNVENIGNIVVAPVVLTDTYDSLMRLDSGIGVNYWRWWELQQDDANHKFSAAFESLYPGENININFAAITNQDAPLPFGLIFTNTAEITLPPDDIVPADNTDAVALTTGPDLFVKKTLVAGKLLPGELITFSLTFGNGIEGWQQWWRMTGTAWLTDTLPAGLEYIASAQHWCESTEWCPLTPTQNGQTYTWELWPLNSGEWNEICLTVRIAATATGLDTFTNQAEIASDQPDMDVEPDYDNNVASADVVVDLPYFEVGKVYESTAVAGTPITYTLTVTNIGNSIGTGVILSDTLPAELSDPGGGTIILPQRWMWWYLDSIAPLGGTATAFFTATLPCRGTVVNADYRVVDSDQGVVSTVGAPVSVDVLTPTFTIGFQAVPTPPVYVSTTVAFTDTTTTNGGAPIVAWTWDFGDGATGSGITTTHTYVTAGELVVTLTVTDACGYSDFYTRTLLVNPPALVASFDQSATLVEPGVTVYFTDTSTTNLPPIVAWAWDFGDGSPLLLTQNVSHAYDAEDTFTVTLTITDTLGFSDSYQSTVRVATNIQSIYLPLVMRSY